MKYGEGQLQADAYTMMAQVKLRCAEEDKKIQEAIRDGDQTAFEDILKYTVDYRLTWGDHIRRFVYDSIAPGNLALEDLSNEAVMEFIKKAFKDNGMANRGSMDPKRVTKLGSRLKVWMESPAVKISRQTCFLFCFGLNMDEEQASYMLTYVLRQADFDPRDPKEAIYYYCLKYNLQYAGVVRWLEWYDGLALSDDVKETGRYEETIVLKKDLYSLKKDMDDRAFKAYLTGLKESRGSGGKNSRTRAAVFKKLLSELGYAISDEKCGVLSRIDRKEEAAREKNVLNFKDYTRRQKTLSRLKKAQETVDPGWLEQTLLRVPDGTVTLPSAIGRMVEEKIIELPSFTEKSLEKKISDRETEVSREDILMAVFLNCACGMGDKTVEEDETYRARKSEFVYEANRDLDACGFGGIYLLNPFDLFLVSCLLQERPLNYFLTVWKTYRKKAGDEHEK